MTEDVRELHNDEIDSVAGGVCLTMTGLLVAAKIILNSRPSCDDMPGPGCDWTQ